MVDGGAVLVEDLSNGIAVVPVRIRLGDADFVDSGDPEEYAAFYQRLRDGAVPGTSTPAPGEYLDAFRRLDSDRIVCLTIPAAWSGMHGAASLAADLLAGDEGRRRVTVVDTNTAAMGLALVARVAADAVSRGSQHDALIEAVERASAAVRMYGALETLTYVARSGRVPALIAGISNTLHIRPVFRMHGAETGRVALARTPSGALEALQKAATEQLNGVPHRLLVFHADAASEASQLAERLDEVSPASQQDVIPLSPLAGSYTGPGAFGFAAIPAQTSI